MITSTVRFSEVGSDIHDLPSVIGGTRPPDELGERANGKTRPEAAFHPSQQHDLVLSPIVCRLRLPLCKWQLIALFLLALGVVPSSVMAATTADFQTGIMAKTGAEPEDLPYRYLVPTGYDATNSYPLIVLLHGSGECGTDNISQLNNEGNGALQLVSAANQAIEPCFMLAPQTSEAAGRDDKGWNAHTLGQVMRVIEKLQATYPIDHNRIYVTGMSMGGAGTWSIITRYPFVFAAAVPMSGWGEGSYGRIVGIPIWNFHAVNDDQVPIAFSDQAVNAVRQEGGRVIYTRYATGGHGIWATAYANPQLRPWLLAQRRNQPMVGRPALQIHSTQLSKATTSTPSTITVKGSADLSGGVAEVTWAFPPSTDPLGFDTSTYAVAEGTMKWAVKKVPMTKYSKLFLAIARGSSGAVGTGGATGGGSVTVNDLVWIVPPGADRTPPTISLVTPTSAGSLTTSASSLDLRGVAAAAEHKTVMAIMWQNNRGGQGIGLGATDWQIDGIDLKPGKNIITLTARDSKNITASTVLVVQVGKAAAKR